MAEGRSFPPEAPQTSVSVVQAAAANRWFRVRQAMIGPISQRVYMDPHSQKQVLELAVKWQAFVFVNEVVLCRFPFAPRTLDIVILPALRRRDYYFVESVLLNAEYSFDDTVLLEVFLAFCDYRGWVRRAHQIIPYFPSNTPYRGTIVMLYDELRACSIIPRDVIDRLAEAISAHFQFPFCQNCLRKREMADGSVPHQL